MTGKAARRRLRHPAKTEWRVASEIGVASGQWPVASGQWPVNPEGVASGKWRRVAVGKANPSAASRRKRGAWQQKKRQTKPIWNRSKAWNRKNLSQKRPGRRSENKAKVPRGRRPESRARAMADRLGRAAGGRWAVKPKAASCFVWRGFPRSLVRTTLILRVTGR